MALAARVGLQLWIVAFILFFGTEVVHQEPMLRIIAQLLFGIPLAAWALTRLRGRDPMDLPIAVAIGAFLVVSLLGRDPVGSLEAAGLVTAYAVLYRAIRWFAARPEWRETLALGAATGLAATLAINAWLLFSEKLTAINDFHAIPSLEGVQVFPWETVNAMPILVLVAIPFLGWSPPGAVRRLLIGTVVVAGAVVVPISVGRAGWMALGLTAVAYFVVRPGARLPLADLPRALRIVLLGLAGIVAVIAVILATGAVIRGLGESARLILWQQSAGMVGDRPLLGSGPSTYSWARMQYGPQEARLVAVRLTHDVPLQTAIDGGLVLIAGLATLIVGWARQVWIGWAGIGRAQRLGVATLIGFAAASLLDDFSFLPSVMGLVIGIAAYALPAREPDGSGGRWPPLIVAVVLAAVTIPAAFAGSAARTDAINGRSAALAGDWERAAVDYRAATEARSGLALYWIELGQAEAGRGDAAAAGSAYATARDRNPGDPRPPAALAQLSGSHALRVDLLREAADLTIGDPQYAYRLGSSSQRVATSQRPPPRGAGRWRSSRRSSASCRTRRTGSTRMRWSPRRSPGSTATRTPRRSWTYRALGHWPVHRPARRECARRLACGPGRAIRLGGRWASDRAAGDRREPVRCARLRGARGGGRFRLQCWPRTGGPAAQGVDRQRIRRGRAAGGHPSRVRLP